MKQVLKQNSQTQHPPVAANKIFVALDVPDREQAIALVETLSPLGVSFKIGMQLFYAEGMGLVRSIQALQEKSGHPKTEAHLFIDLKLHDIPNTVARACQALVEQGVTFFNLHTLGGTPMMVAAAEAVAKTSARLDIKKPTLIGVTVLTSHDARSLESDLKIAMPLSAYVEHLAKSAQDAGLDGVVCSAQEASALKRICGEKFLKVTPGIRMPEDDAQDQSRILTPKAAFEAGATHLVIGRPITQAKDPVEAARQILQSVGL